MTRTERVINRQAFEATMWEQSFAILSEGIELHTQKEIDNAIKIMMSIDKEFTLMLLSDSPEETAATTDDTITVYHGSHNDNVTFTNDRTITNYNHIGTWFTSTEWHANTLYGSHVYKCLLTINNPLYATTEDFDNVFYIESIAKQFNVTINNLWNNGAYIQAVKEYYTSQGYDTIIFENSRIDLSPEDKEHTVYIVLDTNIIK